jgi:hypothetical protein
MNPFTRIGMFYLPVFIAPHFCPHFSGFFLNFFLLLPSFFVKKSFGCVRSVPENFDEVCTLSPITILAPWVRIYDFLPFAFR